MYVKTSFVFKFSTITMETTMMLVKKARGEAELVSGTNNMKFFLVSVVTFNPHALAMIPATTFSQRNSLQ